MNDSSCDTEWVGPFPDGAIAALRAAAAKVMSDRAADSADTGYANPFQGSMSSQRTG